MIQRATVLKLGLNFESKSPPKLRKIALAQFGRQIRIKGLQKLQYPSSRPERKLSNFGLNNRELIRIHFAIFDIFKILSRIPSLSLGKIRRETGWCHRRTRPSDRSRVKPHFLVRIAPRALKNRIHLNLTTDSNSVSPPPSCRLRRTKNCRFRLKKKIRTYKFIQNLKQISKKITKNLRIDGKNFS